MSGSRKLQLQFGYCYYRQTTHVKLSRRSEIDISEMPTIQQLDAGGI